METVECGICEQDMKVRARNVPQLAEMIWDWFSAQRGYCAGDPKDATIDGDYDLTSLARYLAEYTLYEIVKVLVSGEKLPYGELPSAPTAIPWAGPGDRCCNAWSGQHPINQRCKLKEYHLGPHIGDYGQWFDGEDND